jgi:hypothetical protein
MKPESMNPAHATSNLYTYENGSENTSKSRKNGSGSVFHVDSTCCRDEQC